MHDAPDTPAPTPTPPPPLRLPPLGWCAHCLFDRADAERLDPEALPQVQPAVTTVGGDATCDPHVRQLAALRSADVLRIDHIPGLVG